MEQNTKILNITGESKAGKTTLAFELAQKIEKNNENVVIISFNRIEPLAHYIPNYNNYTYSLGYLLTRQDDLSQKEILKAFMPITENIMLLSYMFGDSFIKYPELNKERIGELYDLLTPIVDHIIILSNGNLQFGSSQINYIIADKILNVIEPTDRCLSYIETMRNIQTYKKLLNKQSKEILIINKIHDYQDGNYYMAKCKYKDCYQLPYLDELNALSNQFDKTMITSTHEILKYKKELNKLTNYLYGYEIPKERIIEEEKPIPKEESIITGGIKGWIQQLIHH